MTVDEPTYSISAFVMPILAIKPMTTKLDVTKHSCPNICNSDKAMTPMQGDTEDIRRPRSMEINSTVESDDGNAERQRLEYRYGQIWDAAQLAKDFDVLSFLAPYVVVGRRSDGRKGSLEFQHLPRFYFNFVLD